MYKMRSASTEKESSFFLLITGSLKIYAMGYNRFLSRSCRHDVKFKNDQFGHEDFHLESNTIILILIG